MCVCECVSDGTLCVVKWFTANRMDKKRKKEIEIKDGEREKEKKENVVSKFDSFNNVYFNQLILCWKSMEIFEFCGYTLYTVGCSKKKQLFVPQKNWNLFILAELSSRICANWGVIQSWEKKRERETFGARSETIHHLKSRGDFMAQKWIDFHGSSNWFTRRIFSFHFVSIG